MILQDIPVRVHCRRAEGDAFMLRYNCPLTGAFRSVPRRKSGLFSTKKEAFEWAEKNICKIIDGNTRFISRQKWRLNDKVLRQFNEYSIWRKAEYSRSYRYELTVLSNYVIPFFMNEQGLNDPNKWGEFGEEFTSWLQGSAKKKDGKLLAKNTVQRIVSAGNQFLKWMCRKKYIAYANYRPFELIHSRNHQRRSHQDLISDEVFHKVHAYMKTKSQLYADMWYVQGRMGFRISELIGLAFHWLSHTCPSFIAEEFRANNIKVFGSIYLESQIAKQDVVRDKFGGFPRAPLKGRPAIGVEFSRTVPVLDNELWKILFRCYEVQVELWSAKVKKYGEEKDNYLLFDGAQSNAYRELIKEAFLSIGLVSTGTHIHRHTLSTKLAALKINSKVAELCLGHNAAAHERYVLIVAQVNFERSKAMLMPVLPKNVEN